jgi:hypothetical protein
MPAYRLTGRSGAPLKIERQPHDEGNDKEDNRQRAFRHALSCYGYAAHLDCQISAFVQLNRSCVPWMAGYAVWGRELGWRRNVPCLVTRRGRTSSGSRFRSDGSLACSV